MTRELAPRAPEGRKSDQIRPLTIETGVNRYAEGSVLIKAGFTHAGSPPPVVAGSVAMVVPIWAAAPEPSARKTRYPVAPVTAIQVTVTLAVLVPSVAATPVGAGTLRQPVVDVPGALSPAAVLAFTQ